MTPYSQATGPEAKVVYGFVAKVTQKTLSSGARRVKSDNLIGTFGQGLAPVKGGPPIDATLTNASDQTPWPVQLVANDDESCSVTGLHPWLSHCGAAVGDKLSVDRRAGPTYFIELIRNTAVGPATANTDDVNIRQQEPTGVGSHPDRSGAAVPPLPGMGTVGTASWPHAAGRRMDSRGWVRVPVHPQCQGGEVHAQPRQPEERSSRPGPWAQGASAQRQQPGAPGSDTAVPRVKLEPGAAGAPQQGQKQQGGWEALGRGQGPGVERQQQHPREQQVHVQQQQQQQQQPGARVSEGALVAVVKQEPQACTGEGVVVVCGNWQGYVYR